MKSFLPLLFVVISMSLFSQTPDRKDIQSWTDNEFVEAVSSLRDFLSLPNNGNVLDNIDQNLKWCEKKFNDLGFKSSILSVKGVKHLLAEQHVEDSKPTILFYLQIDGQPVDSSAWDQSNPYLAVLKDCSNEDCFEVDWNEFNADYDPNWKIFARSASDSKGPAIAFMQSLKILRKNNLEPDFNIKVIMDFQEELGSPTLPDLVEKNRDQFKADVMLIMDGTRPPGNKPTLTFGARGIATMKLKVFGPRNDLHSGQYGNYAPNPVFELARLLASMKDEQGRVTISGFYEGVSISEEERHLINLVPDNKEILLHDLGIHEPESIANTYQESLLYPSLNVRGLRAAWVEDEVRTIIPAEALAELDMRLVPETPAKRQIDLVLNHIKSLGFKILDTVPTDQERQSFPKLIQVNYRIGSKPFRTPLNSALGEWLGEAMERVFGKENYYRTQTTGGSQPISPFITTLGIPAISVRIPNPDNNIHAPNENLRLGNFHEGIKMCLAILTQKYE